MTENDTPDEDVFLTSQEVFARYRCGRSKGYELLKSPGFPPRIGMGFSLRAIRQWEKEQNEASVAQHAAEADPSTVTPGTRNDDPRSRSSAHPLPAPRTRRRAPKADS